MNTAAAPPPVGQRFDHVGIWVLRGRSRLAVGRLWGGQTRICYHLTCTTPNDQDVNSHVASRQLSSGKGGNANYTAEDFLSLCTCYLTHLAARCVRFGQECSPELRLVSVTRLRLEVRMGHKQVGGVCEPEHLEKMHPQNEN